MSSLSSFWDTPSKAASAWSDPSWYKDTKFGDFSSALPGGFYEKADRYGQYGFGQSPKPTESSDDLDKRFADFERRMAGQAFQNRGGYGDSSGSRMAGVAGGNVQQLTDSVSALFPTTFSPFTVAGVPGKGSPLGAIGQAVGMLGTGIGIFGPLGPAIGGLVGSGLGQIV